MASRFSIEATFSAIDRLTRPVRKMMKQSKSFTKSLRRDFAKAQRSVDRFSRSVGTKLKNALKVGVVSALLALSFGVAAAASQFVSFDHSITNATAKFKDIDVKSKQSIKSMEQLRIVARKVGAETQFSATEAGEGLMFLAQAGFTSVQGMKLLPGVVNLATIANVDLARATDIASDALGAFGLMTDDTAQLQKNFTRIQDVMAKTITSTNTDMEQLFDTMTFAGPAFTSAGQSIESFSALSGRMAANGIKASKSGTALRSGILRLVAPPKQARDALENLSIAIKDSSGNMLPIIGIVKQIADKTKKMGNVQKSATLSAIFGQRAFSGWAAIIGEGVDKTEALHKSLLKAKGSAAEMSAFIRTSFSNRLKILKSSLIELGFKFIEAFEKQGGNALSKFTKAIQNFDPTPVISGLKTIVKMTGTFLSILKPLLPFIISMTAAWKLYTIGLMAAAFAQQIYSKSTGLSKLKLMILVIGALIGLIWTLKNNWDSFSKSTKEWIVAGGTAIGVIGTIIILVKAWKVAQIALNIALSANPIMLIIAAIGLLVSAIKFAVDNFDVFKKRLQVWASAVEVILKTMQLSIFKTLSSIPGIGDKFKESLNKSKLELLKAAIDFKKNFKDLEKLEKKTPKFLGIIDTGITGAKADSFKEPGGKFGLGFDKLFKASDFGNAGKTEISGEKPSTTREILSRSISERNSNQNVTIRNESRNTVDSKGGSIPTGSSLIISPSG